MAGTVYSLEVLLKTISRSNVIHIVFWQVQNISVMGEIFSKLKLLGIVAKSRICAEINISKGRNILEIEKIVAKVWRSPEYVEKFPKGNTYFTLHVYVKVIHIF